jgi:putative transposase
MARPLGRYRGRQRLYTDLADGHEARPSGYRGRVADALPQDMPSSRRDVTNSGFIPGSRRFQQQIAKMVGRRTWTGTSGRPRESSTDGSARSTI